MLELTKRGITDLLKNRPKPPMHIPSYEVNAFEAMGDKFLAAGNRYSAKQFYEEAMRLAETESARLALRIKIYTKLWPL